MLTTSLSVAMEIGGMWWGLAAVSGRLIALAAFYLPPPCVVGVGFPSYLLVAPSAPFSSSHSLVAAHLPACACVVAFDVCAMPCLRTSLSPALPCSGRICLCARYKKP